MIKETISNRQGVSLVFVFLFGSAIIFIPALDAGKDAWLATIFAAICSLPILFIYCKLLYLFPNKDIFDIVTILFGKFLGKLLALVFLIFPTLLSIEILRIISEFITITSLTNTPINIPLVFLGFLCIWIIKEGIETIGRFSQFFIIILLTLTIISLLLLIPDLNIDNMKPFFQNGFYPFLKGSFHIFSYPITELLVFTMIFYSFKSKDSLFKMIFPGLLMATFLGSIYILFVILSLDINTAISSFFPAYIMVKMTSITTFIQRTEIIFILTFIIFAFIKLVLCILATSKGLSKIFNFNNYRFIVTPVVLLLINFSIISFKNISEILYWKTDIWPIFAFPFEVVLPIIVFIVAKIRKLKININI